MGPSIIVTGPNRHSASSLRGRSEQLRASAANFPICLVTGGAGYIGSHTVLELLTAGFAVVVIDNLCNSHMESLYRVYYLAKTEFERCGEGARPIPPIFLHKIDIRDAARVKEVFDFWEDGKALEPERLPVDVAAMVAKKAYPTMEWSIDMKKRTKVNFLSTKPESHGKIACVIHFAALKAVGESLTMPLEYYEVNVAGLLVMLKAMRAHNVNTFVFSSSAVVYGKGHGEAITEEAVQIAGQGNGGGLLTNPYGRTKWMCEEIINDFCASNEKFHATALRYFNPTGAHPSGLIGENPKGVPNNIVPVILSAYERRRSKVQVFGSSYDTPDGTGVRDYIHVTDLAKGHLAALRKAVTDQYENAEANAVVEPGTQYHVYNLGTGKGYSVLEIIQAFSKAAGTDVPFAIGEARPGDLGTVTAAPHKAATELDWTAEFDIQDMCRDVYNWAVSNPGGYEKLRRLSTMSGAPAKEMRKMSVASHLFESEEEFDVFMANTAASMQSSNGSAYGHRRQSSANSNRQSVTSLGQLLQRTRLSISSSSSDEDKHSAKSSHSSATSPTAFSPFTPSFAQPRFNMNWSESSTKASQHDLQAPIEEEEEP
ncbi:hypothetical protein N0V82_006507 [Gnomoniopsis sp. IMI 355080]|nr:hypothetical protein N0V82_006507 [Gnomoniopsis sp. IMI 355080]